MDTITGNDLLKAGFVSGSVLGKALSYSKTLLSEGWSPEMAIREATRLFKGSEVEKLRLRAEALDVKVACTIDNDEEMSNLELSLNRIREISKVPVVERVALMPDNCPSGGEWGSIPVGGAVVTEHCILPSVHSADINCGMCLSFFETRDGAKRLTSTLGESCLFGPFPAPKERQVSHPVLDEGVWSNPFLQGLEEEARIYLGTQGDGNHFSSLGVVAVSNSLLETLEDSGNYELIEALRPYRGRTLHTLVTHHGSRKLGAMVYRRGIKQAEKYTSTIADGIPKNGCWLDTRTEEGNSYMMALDYVGRWTEANHEVVHERFLVAAGARKIARLSNHHNAIWRHSGKIYHGKGATPAWRVDGRPQIGIIPLNMGSEILLVKGLDNDRFLSFAPHGAGRNKSRTALKSSFVNPDTGQEDPDLIRQSIGDTTSGLEIVWASGQADISEAPVAYKPAAKIKEELLKYGLASVMEGISPIGCMMAGHRERIARRIQRGGKSLSKVSETRTAGQEI